MRTSRRSVLIPKIVTSLAKSGKALTVTPEALEQLVTEGYSLAYGARFLKRVIESREIFHDEMLHLMRQIMAGKRKPDYAACVTIVTNAALKEMVVPGSLAVATATPRR